MTKSILIAKDLAIPVGIIGTLIGFVNMLSSLDDPSALGPAIGVALLSTLYGILIFVLCHIALGYFSSINSTTSKNAPIQFISLSNIAAISLLLIVLIFVLCHIALGYFSSINSTTSKNAPIQFISLSNIAAISLLLIVFFAGIEVHGSFFSFIDSTSLLFVGLLVCIPTYFEKHDKNQAPPMSQRYQSVYKYSVIGMVVAMLCSTISICSNVQDPTAIGPAMAWLDYSRHYIVL